MHCLACFVLAEHAILTLGPGGGLQHPANEGGTTMSPLALSAISDFILAAEALFVAGMLVVQPRARGSAHWYWNWSILCLGVGSFVAAVDHGFIEGRDLLPDTNIVTRCGWLAVGVAVAALLAAIQAQFFPRRPWILAIALVQFAIFVAAVFASDRYIVVSLNAAPELLLLLGLAIPGVKRGMASPALIVAPALVILASAVQASGFDGLAPVDHNVLYHLIMLVAVAFFYPAGQGLSRER
jgi:hypothetical protein